MTKNEALTLELEAFEGPLDLLLHLINQMEIDIYDIPIAKITDQYMDYIRHMQIVQIDIASEYFVMAATLMRIKSEMLVPRNEHQATIEEDLYDEEDPRMQLIDLLLEYKQIKEVIPKFEERSKDRAGYFGKDPSNIAPYQEKIEMKNQGLTAEDLANVFRDVLKRHQLEMPHSTMIEADEMTVVERMQDIRELINLSVDGRISFSQLIKNPSRKIIVITFLALLELIKDNRVLVQQESTQSDISISIAEDKNEK